MRNMTMKRIRTALCLILAAALLAGCAFLPSDSEPETPAPTDPLTGQEQLWPGQRPVAVSIENASDSTTQWGLSAASVVLEARTELQGSTLTAGRTAEQVGDQRRDKNERRHAQRQFIAGMDGGEYKVCAGIALIVKQAVGTYNENTSDRKQENKPRIFCADERDKSHAQIKKCAHRSDQHTGEDGEYHPFQGSL